MHRSTQKLLLSAVFVIVLIIVIKFSTASLHPHTSTSTQKATPIEEVLGQRTKASGCVINGELQDRACTPGAIFDAATKDEICQSGYALRVRDVPESEKIAVYKEYGIATHTAGQYEVDHLISLELGGSNDIANLWPEAANPKPGFHEKDEYENYLHQEVCNGSLSLQDAQYRIATDWYTNWKQDMSMATQ